MFGEKIDYWLLRPFAHDRARATEEELSEKAKRAQSFDPVAAYQRLEKLIKRFEGNFRVDSGLSYLDVGCGGGDLALALVQAGATDVTGIDKVERYVEAARIAAEQVGGRNRPKFICADINTWEPERCYDITISHEALEHIDQPDRFLRSLPRLLKPDGVVFLAFGPLFHSPFGDHCDGFFRVNLPWRGVLFSEKALLRLRQEFFRPDDIVKRFQDIVGGLNLIRYSEFLNYTYRAGFEFQFLSVNPQLKRVRLLYLLSEMLTRVPVMQDYFAISVYAMLKRADK